MSRLLLIPLLTLGLFALAQEANAQVPVTDDDVTQQRVELDERLERIDQQFHGVENYIEQHDDPMQRQAYLQRLDELRTQRDELRRDIQTLEDVEHDIWTDRFPPVNERLLRFEQDLIDWHSDIGFRDLDPR